MSKKKYTKQQLRKYFDKKCFFCGLDQYELLDAHRIFEGNLGGTYNWDNILILCANCHRKSHNGIIKILGKHQSSLGVRVIHYIEDGKEYWKS